MAYSFVSATSAGVNNATFGLTILAGQKLVIMANDAAAINSTLTISDTLGNVYAVRGTVNDTRNGDTSTLIDCLSPIAGATTLTLAGAVQPGMLVAVYTGLASYSAGSFASFFSGATPPTATDGCTTAAITPTSYPAALVGFCFFGSTSGMAVGTGFTSRFASTNGLAGGNAGYLEDLDLAAGSHIASFTMAAGGTDVSVLGAAYIEATSGVTLALTGQSATSTPGALAPSATRGLSGTAAAFTPGTVTASTGANLTVALSGQSAAFTAGTLIRGVSVTLAGSAATFTTGVILAGTSASLTGSIAASAAGTLGHSTAGALSGQPATFAAGTVTASTGGNLTLSLSGQASAFGSGLLAPTLNLAPNGQAAVLATGTVGAVNGVALTGQTATMAAGALGVSVSWAVSGTPATFAQGTLGLLNGVLSGGPRYIVSRGTGRKFIGARQIGRAFNTARTGRAFKVSATMSQRFDTKDPSESVKLTFDFSPDLALLPAVVLTGSPTVTFAVVFGTDPSPANVANGAAGLDSTSTKVIVPVTGGVGPTTDYSVRVVIATTDPKTILELTGILPVRS